MMEIETQKEKELREKNGCFAYGIPSMKRARNYQLSSSTISALFSGAVGEREGEGGGRVGERVGHVSSVFKKCLKLMFNKLFFN